jgi:hypothetical protein
MINIKDKKAYVYLMFDGKYFKIGKTNNLKKRVKQFRTSNIDIKLVAYKYSFDAIKEEKFLHKIFSKYKIEYEWFKFNNIYEFSKLWLLYESFTCDFKKLIKNIYDFDSDFIDRFIKENFDNLEKESDEIRKEIQYLLYGKEEYEKFIQKWQKMTF